MRKSLVPIFLILLPVLLLAGCTAKPAVPPETAPPAETATPTEIPSAAETESASAAEPYLLQIDRCDQSVFSGPGYDFSFVDTVRGQGTFHIAEVQLDSEGNLWGKLNSGIGWVDISQIQSEEYKNALISANYADDSLLASGEYHHYSDNQEYGISIAFRAYGTLRDVTIFEMGFSEEGPFPGADVFTLSEMTEEIPLVAELAFPGDMSMYGIRFSDEAGVTHIYRFYPSLRNGALMLEKQ